LLHYEYIVERNSEVAVPLKSKGEVMKNILMLAIIAIFLMMPLASFAKTAISESDLDAVTAEAGVSVVFTNLTVGGTTTLTSLSWGDGDGFTGYTAAGYAGMNAFTVTGNLAVLSGTMNVDIGTSGGSTRVNVLLPTITLGAMNVAATMKLSGASDLSGGNVLGNIKIENFSTTITGTVTLYTH
jgi:hypothetical protein